VMTQSQLCIHTVWHEHALCVNTLVGMIVLIHMYTSQCGCTYMYMHVWACVIVQVSSGQKEFMTEGRKRKILYARNDSPYLLHITCLLVPLICLSNQTGNIPV